MELEINIEDLLNKRRIESDRIDFKASWNPDDIYHTICAFANDYDNVGGGYILIGVEEKHWICPRANAQASQRYRRNCATTVHLPQGFIRTRTGGQ